MPLRLVTFRPATPAEIAAWEELRANFHRALAQLADSDKDRAQDLTDRYDDECARRGLSFRMEAGELQVRVIERVHPGAVAA